MNQQIVAQLGPLDVVMNPAPSSKIYDGDISLWPSVDKWVHANVDFPALRSQIQEGTLAMLPLRLLDLNTWRALRTLQDMLMGYSRTQELEDASRYHCPYLGSSHTALVPLALLTTQVALYRSKLGSFLGAQELCGYIDDGSASGINSRSAHRLSRGHYIDDMVEVPAVVQMGPGFTNICLPMDGRSVRRPVLVNMANGDSLLCACWVWMEGSQTTDE